MKTIQCACGEYIEINGVTVCLNCLECHYPTDEKDIKYRYHCPHCDKGFNGIMPKCPTCKILTQQKQSKYVEDLIDKKYLDEVAEPEPIKDETPYIPQPDYVDPYDYVPSKYVYEEEKKEPKSTFARDLMLGFVCFNSGFTWSNLLEYAVIKTLMKK